MRSSEEGQDEETVSVEKDDLSAPRMAFGRACLIGDAAFVPRPDTAAGTAKAVTDAAELAKSLSDRRGNDIAAALEEVGAGPARARTSPGGTR